MRQELLDVILEAFALPPLPFEVSKAFSVLAGERAVFKTRIFNQLKRFGGSDVPADVAASTHRILGPLSKDDGPLGIAARHTIGRLRLTGDQELAIMRPWLTEDSPEPSTVQTALSVFIDEDLSGLVEPGHADTVEPFAREVRLRTVATLRSDPKVVIGPNPQGKHSDFPYPTSGDVRLAIVAALESVEPRSWGAAIEVGDSLWRDLRRQPVGTEVCPSSLGSIHAEDSATG